MTTNNTPNPSIPDPSDDETTNLPPSHPAMSQSTLQPSPTQSPCHPVTPSPRHPVILSPCHLDALSPNQIIALNALAAGKRKHEAATAAGINRNTLTRWLQFPAFRAALNQELHELTHHTAMRSAHVTTLALDTLQKILESDEPATVKIQAARAIFHHRPPPPSPLHSSTSPHTLASQDLLASLTQRLINDLNQ